MDRLPDNISDATETGRIATAEKVAFLSRPDSYPSGIGTLTVCETSKSWVFLAGDKVYKLKKPLRTPYFDFTSLAQREAACKAEVRLNRRLASETYLGFTPLSLAPTGLRIGWDGEPAEWLVVMRRLDERMMLATLIRDGRLEMRQLDRLADTLRHFYAHACPTELTADGYLAALRHTHTLTRRELLAAAAHGLPPGPVRRIAHVQSAFLGERQKEIAARVSGRHVVDAHGDLRPEHIWLGDPVQIIDCLEFNAALRTADTLAEVAFLDLECERLGAAWAGAALRARIAGKPRGAGADALYLFYRSMHATLRARLAIAHLDDPAPRLPDKWLPLALSYLTLAHGDATRLNALISTAV